MELQKHAYLLELGMVTNTNVCLNWAICFFILKSEVEGDETSLFEWAFQFPPRLLLSLSLSVAVWAGETNKGMVREQSSIDSHPEK